MSKEILIICSTTAVSHSFKGDMILKILNLQAKKVAQVRKLLKITTKCHMRKASCRKYVLILMRLAFLTGTSANKLA